MSADGKIDLRDLSTTAAPAGSVMVSDGVRWKPGTAGGGGLLGYAEVSFSNSTPISANGTSGHPDSSSLGTVWGSPGITVNGTGGWHYDTDGVNSVYLATATYQLSTAAGSPAATDITACQIDVGLATGMGTFLGTHMLSAEVSGIYQIVFPSSTITPLFKAWSTTTGLTLYVQCTVYVSRFAS